ncbi:MAG: protein kinase [Planctomycetota bacterium]|jgi:serine/threonine protein kinase|nr:protein kinase [Planctomycetota bacterium]
MPVLVVERGALKGRTVNLTPGQEVTVGRETSCTLEIADNFASRRHFQLVCMGPDEVRLTDMGSMNGTVVNGEQVTGEIELQIGDSIQVGDTLFSILSGQKQLGKGELSQQVISGYQVGDRIGRGGMGTVYKATQLSLNRTVALKFLSKELVQDKTFIDKFVQEARSAGSLNHPNIIQVYDVASEKDETLHYFSMEYAPKGSVGEKLTAEGPLSILDSLKVCLDSAQGLEYAFRNDIVHKDIKPDNLMIGEDGTVKIGDMGLAERIQKDAGPKKQEANLGTPHYASPEQIKGKAVDIRSDLYSLGATLYHILSGQTPFSGDNMRAIIIQQIRDMPPPIQEIRPEIPEIIVDIIYRLMAKDPADRYQTPRELIEDLEPIYEKYLIEDLRSKPLPPLRRIGAFTSNFSRYFLPIFLIGVGLVAILIFKPFTSTSPAPPPSHPPTPQAPTKIQEAIKRYQKLVKRHQEEGPTRELLQAIQAIAKEFPEEEVGKVADQSAKRVESALKKTAENRQYKASQGLKRVQSLLRRKVHIERAIDLLESIIKQFPETSAAAEAKELLEKVRKERDLQNRWSKTSEQSRKKINTWIGSKQFGKAREALESFKKEIPKGITTDLPEELDRSIRTKEKEAYESIRNQVRDASSRREYQKAIEILERVREFDPKKWNETVDLQIQNLRDEEKSWKANKERDRIEAARRAMEKCRQEVLNSLAVYDFKNARSIFRSYSKRSWNEKQKSELDQLSIQIELIDQFLDDFEQRLERRGQVDDYNIDVPKSSINRVKKFESTHLGSLQSSRLGSFNRSELKVQILLKFRNGESGITVDLKELSREESYRIFVGTTKPLGRWSLEAKDALRLLALSDSLNQQEECRDLILYIEKNYRAATHSSARQATNALPYYKARLSQ